MAIAFARARYLSRSKGDNAVRTAAYNARQSIKNERISQTFCFAHRGAPEHREVLLPDGSDTKFADAAKLWNAAELAEGRWDSQIAREIVLALPANHRVALARSLALLRARALRLEGARCPGRCPLSA